MAPPLGSPSTESQLDSFVSVCLEPPYPLPCHPAPHQHLFKSGPWAECRRPPLMPLAARPIPTRLIHPSRSTWEALPWALLAVLSPVLVERLSWAQLQPMISVQLEK